ncbi:BatD family protein [Bosea sp. BIWAKO-01]|uniref:BatD family protein n=1 Tax=Bosea sp. BIWAKO-01 TaxID=506668 RepID=UPI00086F58EC|nr:BatD family protein [Bosea sp. BIWAKO-01]GAU83186.1 BatD [Bosea sp. BIWAKO-01]
MIRLLFLPLLLILAVAALAQTPAGVPVVRTSLAPADGIVIGQPVRLHVEVLFPGDMPRPPLVKVPETAGAQVMRFETQGITIRDHIDAQDYVGQRFEFVVFPRRGGDIGIPAADITLLDKSGDPIGSATGESKHITVTIPPGIDASGPVLAASRVGVSESWSPDPASTTFKAGSAITRTIRRQAADVPALGMAEFRFTAPEGVRVYADPPTVEDKVDRGSVEGHRTDKVTYVFEKPGNYILPALSQPWWDTDDRQARTETLAGVTVNVAAATAPSQRPRWQEIMSDWRKLVGPVLGAALLLLASAIIRPRLITAWRSRRQRHLASEAFARRRLLRIAGSGDASTTYRALTAWLERLSPENRDAVRREPLITQLERSLFGGKGSWTSQNGAELATLLARLPKTRTHVVAATSPPLPPLNPQQSLLRPLMRETP